MANDPNQPVKHYELQPEAYNAVLRILGQLPYQQVAGVISQLQAQTRAVYQEPPPGRIDRSGKTPAPQKRKPKARPNPTRK